MKNIKEPLIENLITSISKLPGIGKKTAEKLALEMLKKPEDIMLPLGSQILKTADAISYCNICYNFAEGSICKICADGNRLDNILCILEEVSDIWAFEKGGFFNGKYHILGGRLSAVNGITPEDLKMNQLFNRIKNTPSISEVIIATNSTIDGQTTAFYISEHIQQINPNINITRLANGIPLGGEVSYLDEGTLQAAFTLRNAI